MPASVRSRDLWGHEEHTNNINQRTKLHNFCNSWSNLLVTVIRNYCGTIAQLLQPSVVQQYELAIVLRWSCVEVGSEGGRDKQSDYVASRQTRANAVSCL